MSQVSYGTITIVDTTDIARIYMVYAKSVSNTTPPSDELTWSESIASAPGEGDFIWQKTVVEKAITEEKTYSDPVCVTGSSGQGVEKIINYYCNYGQGQPEEDYSGWQLEIPEYDGNKPNYWTKVVVIYSDDTREDFQAGGAIATFESKKVGILDSLEVTLNPKQSGSGTPSPSNVRPISGWDSVGVYNDPVYGGTVGWNQLVQNGDFANDTGWGTRFATISIADGIATFTPSSEGTVRGIVQGDMGEYTKANHKYLGLATVKPPKQVQMNLSLVGSGGGRTIIPANVWTTFGQVFTYSNPAFKERLAIYCDTNLTTSDTVQIRNAQLFDLTAMFGSTIADYIYSLEQARAGDGVAWFRNLFPKNYYEYNAGEQTTVSAVNGDPYIHITTTLPTTVYGGTLDVVGGKLDDNMAIVTLDGSNTSPKFTEVSAQTTADGTAYVAFIRHASYGMSDNDTASVSDKYAFMDVPLERLHLGEFNTRGSYTRFVLSDQSITTLDALNAYLADNPIQLVYTLATPTTYSLTPQEVQTFLGRNNVWGDGTVEVRGHTISKRDVMIYKDNGLTDVVNKSAEALDKANDGIVSTTQLWYQTNSTSAPSVPTSHSQIDQGTITYNNWRSARPNNNVDSYKYYYYCYEYLHGDGTYSYSKEVILDTSNLSQYEIDSLNARIKKIWSNSTGSYMASGIGSNEVDIDNPSTYGFNSKSTTTGVSFNYNAIPLTSLGTDGIKMYNFKTTENVITESEKALTIDAKGMNLFLPTNLTTSLVSFGSTTRIGYPASQHIEIKENGFNYTDGSSYYFFVGSEEKKDNGNTIVQEEFTEDYHNIRSDNVVILNSNSWDVVSIDQANIKDTFHVEESTQVFNCSNNIDNIVECKWYDSGYSTYITDFSTDNNTITLNTPLVPTSTNCYLYVTYVTTGVYNFTHSKPYLTFNNITEAPFEILRIKYTKSRALNYLTYGNRRNDIYNKGNFSIAMGSQNMAIGEYSGTFGINNIATREASFAIGTGNNSLNYGTFAVGVQNTAMGECAIALGYKSKASGESSIAIGYELIANGNNQTVFGKYNKVDSNAMFIIGNGSSDSNRSNLFVVDENGNLEVKDGFKITNDTGSYLQLSTNNVEIWQKPTGASASVKVAEFGADGAQIGQSDNTHIEINNNSLDIKKGTTTLSQFTSDMISIGGVGTNARAYIGKNTFKMARLYGDNNSLKYDLPYPFQDDVDADSIRPFQLYQHTITDNEGLYTHLPRRVKINLQAGQSKTVTFEPETSTGMIRWHGNMVKILEAYDANGNTITTDGITAVQNQTTLAVTISIDNNYTDGIIDSILLALVGQDAYGCVICGNYHDFSNWDSIEWDPYWTRTNGWVPYPFVVGIGRRKKNTETGKYYVDQKNGFTVDWNGNVKAAQNITVNNHASHIGTFKSHSLDDISCATGKYYQIAYLTLEPGVWMVDCVGYFPNTNTTGVRDIRVTTATSDYNNVTTAPASYGNITADRRTAAAHIIYANSHFPVSITATTTFRLLAYQNSGQTVSVDGRMYAVRIN